MNKLTLSNIEKADYRKQEAFNYLRNNLQFCGPDLKSFLLTSCEANVGKSTIAFDLARSMAEGGKKTVLVDSDMRKSVLINRYNIQSNEKMVNGLSHYLTKQAELEDVLCETNISNLHMILSGPASPNPAKLLEGNLFEELINYLNSEFDVVIVDTPPLGAVIDAAIMAPICDGSIIILESEVTSYHAALEVKKQLELTGCRILGTVLNKVSTDKNGYYYSHYYKYYGDYK